MQDNQQPMRPVSIIDETIRLVRRTGGVQLLFALVIFGINALMVAPFFTSIFNLAFDMMMSSIGGGGYGGYENVLLAMSGIWGSLLLVLVAGVLTRIVQYGMVIACRNAMQNHNEPFGAVFREVLHNAGRVFLQSLLFGLIMAGAYLALIVVIVILALITAAVGWLGAILMFLFYIAFIVFLLIFVTHISLTEVVNVTEDVWYVAAWGRSWRVMRFSAWRVFGYTLLLGAITMIVSAFLTWLFSLGGSYVFATLGSVISYLIASLVSIVSWCMMTALYHACRQTSEQVPYPQWN